MDEALYQLSWSARLVAAGGFALGVGWWLRRWTWFAAPLAAAGGVLLVFALTVVFAFLRPVPSPVDRALFEGVRYRRTIQRDPQRMVVHMVTVDLQTPGLRVLVTPSEPFSADGMMHQLPARTTSAFLEAFDQQLAVNASYYYEQTSFSIFYYYPRSGDGVSVVGPARSAGGDYGNTDGSMRSLSFFDGRARIAAHPAAGAANAVSGYPLIVDGVVPKFLSRSKSRHPRVGAGVDRASRTLFFVVIDGRAPFYSDGATELEVAELLVRAGAHDGILLDGGGSTTLVQRLRTGGTEVLNLPVHGRMPAGYERPVANHIGFSGLRPAK